MATKKTSLKDRLAQYMAVGLVGFKACEGVRPNDRRIVVLTISPISRVRWVDRSGDNHIDLAEQVHVHSVLPEGKLRASLAFVREVLDLRGRRVPGREAAAFSIYNRTFSYRPNHTIEPDHWDASANVECGGGIHFFLTMERAISWSQHH